MAEVCKWAEFEKCHALTLINEAYDTIYAKFKGSTSGGKDKQAEWNKIAASLNSSGYAQSTRTAHQIKTMHKNIKFKVKSKVDLSKKTGGGPPPVFSQAEQMVLETLKDKPQLSGIVGAIETGSSNLTAHNDDDDIVTDMATLPEEAVLVAEILTVPITEEVQPSTSVSVAEPVVVRRETDRPYRKKSSMERSDIVLIIIVSLTSVALFVLMMMLCAWCSRCCRRKKYIEEEEETLSRSVRSMELGSDSGSDVRQLQRRSCEDKQPHGSGDKKRTPIMTRKTIRFERPDRRVVTEHVQPQTSSSTALNDALQPRRDPTYQSTAPHRPLETQNSKGTSENGDSDSLWKGVRNFATMFMEEGMEDGATSAEPIAIDGIDYRLGKIQLALSYDFQSLTLTLKILQAQQLPAKDFTGTSDPYVKILLLPDKKHKLLTKVKKKNLNPRWNECFLFEGWPHNKLLEKTLYLQVIDYDRFSRDDPIGETYIPLNEVDLSQAPLMWKFLSPCKDSRGKLGELLLSLCYEPNVGRLTVIVIKAKDLKAKDITGASDPYVKLWLCFGKEKVEKKKTSIKMRTLNPVYNESFMFEIQWDKIREACIEVTCMDFDKLGRNEMIGKVLLGSKSGPLETRHWNDMISKPRQQVAQWHLLKD